MTIIDTKNGKEITMQDGEILHIHMLGKEANICIECKHDNLVIEDITDERIKELKVEQEQLQILNKTLKDEHIN